MERKRIEEERKEQRMGREEQRRMVRKTGQGAGTRRERDKE
jgi:hypothetical protein